MSGAIRTWWWAVDEREPARAGLERVSVLLAPAAIRELIASSEERFELARVLAARLGQTAKIDTTIERSENVPGALTRHAGGEVVLLAGIETVRRSIACALALEHSPEWLEIGHGSLHAIDWPDRDDPDGRPALIGVDLDWTPPPPSRKRARFPGGPGSAPSARG